MLVQQPIFSTTSANGSSPTEIKSLPSCGTICTTLMLLIWRKHTKQVISCQWYTCKNQESHGQHYKKWLIPTKGLSTFWIQRLMYLLHHGNFSFHDGNDDSNHPTIGYMTNILMSLRRLMTTRMQMDSHASLIVHKVLPIHRIWCMSWTISCMGSSK